MKILAIIIQSKRGQNQFVVSAHDFSHEKAVLLSKQLYNNILRQFKMGKKIERSFMIDDELMCVCNISKDAIFMLIIDKNYLFLGYDGLKKVTEFFTKNSKLELATKKQLETSILLEEFLYTRELSLSKLTFNFAKQENQQSSKRNADSEQLNRFAHLNSDLEKNLITNIPLKYSKKQSTHCKDKTLIVSLSEAFKLNGLNFSDNEWNQQQSLFNYSTAFKLKSKIIPKDGQNRYQNKLPNSGQKKVDPSQKILTQYQSISSSDMQVIQQKFRQQKVVNLLGYEEGLQPTKTNKSNSVNAPQQQVKNRAQIANNLLDLDYQANNQQSSPQIKPSSGGKTTLPMDLNFQPQSNTELFQIMQITQSNAIPNLQIDLSHKDAQYRQNQQQTSSTFQTPSPSPSPIQLYPFQQEDILNYQLKMIEKMILIQKDGKLKEIKMFGQITVNGDLNFVGQEELILLGKDWNEENGCQKRVSPNSVHIQQVRENAFRVSPQFQDGVASTGVIDYIIPVKFFSQQRVPMILIYKLDQSPQDNRLFSFCLQYKVNDQWFTPLFDVEIEIHLQNDLRYDDLKSIPMANAIQGNVIIWKAQQLSAQQKGKLVLNLMGINKQPHEILDFIKLAVKTNCSILDEMNCVIIHPNLNQEVAAQKRLAVEYKILPNQY